MAFTPSNCNGFENDLLVTVGGTYSAITAGSTVSTQTANPRSAGGRYLQLAPTATAAANLVIPNPTAARRAHRFYFRFEALPAANVDVVFLNGLQIRLTPGGKLISPNSIFTATAESTTTLVAARWYRLEFLLDGAAGSASHWQIDGEAQPGWTKNGTSVTFAAADFGPISTTGPAATLLYDDYLTGTWDVSTDWPGPGRCVAIRPASGDLAVGAASTSFQDQASVTLTATTAFTTVSDPTWTGDPNFAKQTTSSSTRFVQAGMAASSETVAPTVVVGRVNHGASGTAANALRTWFQSGTTDTYLMGSATTGSTIGVTGDLLKSATITPSAAPWTLEQFHAAVLRYGVATDIAPVPFWRNAMLEADFPEATGPVVASGSGAATASVTAEGAGTAIATPKQYARPAATGTVVGTWTGSHLDIDEVTPNDADFIESPTNPDATVFYSTILGAINPPTAPGDVILRVRSGKVGGARTIDLSAEVRQGDGTIIATLAMGTLNADLPTTYAVTLTATEVANVTDWSDVRVRLNPTSAGGGSGSSARIYWVELQAPTGTVVVRGTGSGAADVTGSGAGSRVVSGAGAATAGADGAGAGVRVAGGTGSAAASVSGEGVGSPPAPQGTGTGTADVTGTATGTVVITGAGAASASATSAGAGSRVVTGAADATTSIVSDGTGRTILTGSGAASASAVGAGSGTPIPAGAGAAAATVGASGSGLLVRLGLGSGTTDVTAVGAGVAVVPAFGTPTGLTATPISASRIDLTWSSTVDAIAYDLERGGVIVATVTGTSYSDTGLPASTSQTYRVRAVR